MTPAPRRKAALADHGRIRMADQPEAAGPAVLRLLWGWPEILATTGVPRRSLERELAVNRFPQPVRRVGRRPYWRPADIRRWAEGGTP